MTNACGNTAVNLSICPMPYAAKAAAALADYSAFDLFQWLPKRAQDAFTLASHRRQLSDGRPIFNQGERGNELYRLVSGCVRMSSLRASGHEAVYLMLGPGDCFGACSLIDGAPRSQSTRAQGDVVLQILRRDAFERLRSDYPVIDEAMIRYMSRHLRLLASNLASSMLDDLPCRLAQRLLDASRSFDGAAVRRTGAALRLSQTEIAQMVGASRQSVNKVLRRFQLAGLVAIEYGSVRVLDIDRLRRISVNLT